jgi:hypothetical protein
MSRMKDLAVAEWEEADRRVREQLSPEQLATITEEAFWNLVDMDPAGLASGRSLLDILLHEALDHMEGLGIRSRRRPEISNPRALDAEEKEAS